VACALPLVVVVAGVDVGVAAAWVDVGVAAPCRLVDALVDVDEPLVVPAGVVVVTAAVVTSVLPPE
jgi:hypothetical protein